MSLNGPGSMREDFMIGALTSLVAFGVTVLIVVAFGYILGVLGL